jgi:hypothetical protein
MNRGGQRSALPQQVNNLTQLGVLFQIETPVLAALGLKLDLGP